MYLEYDLHSHSTASDGILSPSLLVSQAQGTGLRYLALTDHDTTEGIAEAKIAADQIGIILVPGVEISVTWGNITVHLVGLGIDHANAKLQQELAGLRKFRAWRAEEIGRRLAKHNIHMAFEGAKNISNGTLISRTHFARFLVQQGFATEERQVFKHFLVPGKPGHVPGEWAKLDQAVDWIKQAGGQAVLAHPGRYKISHDNLRLLITEFRAAGGQAIEVVSGSHCPEDNHAMARLALEFEVLSSAGSDFHRLGANWHELGRLPQLPSGCIPVWRDWPAAKPPR